MTSRTLLLLSFLAASIYTSAQDNYSGFNYQAVVRDAQGQPLPNQLVGVQFILGCGIAAPYVEQHTTTSDGQGLINLVIGEGTVQSGGIASFGAIDWTGCGAASWTITVSMDIAGGTNYVQVGTQQLKAVPFALNALNADDGDWAITNDSLNSLGRNVRIQHDQNRAGLVVETPSYGIVHSKGDSIRMGTYIGQFPTLGDPVGGWLGTFSDHPLYFFTNDGIADVTLDTTGNLGIGTNLPTAKLDVAGNFKLTDGSEGPGKVLTSDEDGLATWAAPSGSSNWALSGNDLSNTNSGNVGIGTVMPSERLEVAGNLRVVGKATMGTGSTNTGTNAFVFGTNNTAVGGTTTISGGSYNQILQSNSSPGTSFSVIGGGSSNSIDQGQRATISGGLSNSISGGAPPNSASSATIAGGVSNNINGNTQAAAIGGGNENEIQGTSGSPGTASVIAGGTSNLIVNSRTSSIGGGTDNEITANYAMIPGGQLNTASGLYAFAAGRRAKALHDGSFVWGDNTNADFSSTAPNQFLIRASNVGIGTPAPTATLSVNGSANNTTGVWGLFSDARIKTELGGFSEGLGVIEQIRPIRFKYNDNAPFPTEDVQIGIVAQELQRIAPYMVNPVQASGFEDLLEVDPQAYTFLLINAVKELNTIAQQQQAMIDELRTSNTEKDQALECIRLQLEASNNYMKELQSTLSINANK